MWGWQKTHKTKRKYKKVLEKLKWTRLEDRRHLGERARKRGGAHRSEETRHGVDVYGARRSARSSPGEGQRAAATAAGRGQREGGLRTWDVGFNLDFSDSKNFCSRVYLKINGIGKFICQNPWFFFSLLVCRCRVGEAKKKEKKKRHSPDTGIRQVVPVPVSDTDTTPKMACPCNLAWNFVSHSLFKLCKGIVLRSSHQWWQTLIGFMRFNNLCTEHSFHPLFYSIVSVWAEIQGSFVAV